MINKRDPFSIKIAGGDIADRDLPGFSDRRYEGTGIPAPEVSSLQRAIHPLFTKLVIALLVIVGAVLLGRLLWLQVAQGQQYRQVAEGNRIRLEVIPAQRGLIFDSHGLPVAVNTPNLALVLVPADASTTSAERKMLFDEVAKIADIAAGDVSSIDWHSYVPITLAEHLSQDQAVRLVTLSSRLAGMSVKILPERKYILGDAAAHLLGYMGEVSPDDLKLLSLDYQYHDYKGIAGVEDTWESVLRGQTGKREVEVNNLGKPQQVYASVDPVAGTNITLTVDSELQNILVVAVKRTLVANHKTKGAAVALDPQTGAILALASFPTFDPNLFSTGGDQAELAAILANTNQPLFNRVYAGTYPPGSTIKPIIGMAALEEGIITTNTTVNSVGGVWAGNRWFADWKAGGHGLTNIYKAIAESVNTFFYIVGGGTENRAGLGQELLAYWLRRFGFGQVTGVNLSGEAEGLVPTPEWKLDNIKERWFLGDTYNLSIGQGNLLVSPLQLASAYAALINGGNIWQPHYVKVLISATGDTQVYEPRLLKSLPVDRTNLEIISRAMRETVLTGSARSLGSVPAAVAGKTGTAQAPGGEPHAWFAGYLPFDSPRLLMVVLIENGVEGSVAAVPVAREVFTWFAQNRL